MINALWITLIGMGLVFAAILLLWGLMALLVRLAAEPEAAEVVEETPEPARAAGSPGEMDRKRRAAAAAVAITLAMRRYGRSAEGASQPAGSVSAWQAVHRASRIGQATTISRKKVER